MGKQALVSVVLPAYNSELYIGEAIHSLLEQSYSNFELIIINDGSTDTTEAIISSFEDKRIRYYFNEKNLGLIATLNRGIDLCTGEFIVRMDADDMSLYRRIEKQVDFMQRHPEIAVAGSWYYAFTMENGVEVKGQTDPEILKSTLLFNTCLCHPATIIRKSVLDKYNFKYDPAYTNLEDYELWLRISKVAQLSNVPEFLFRYRSHDTQISKLHNAHQKELADSLRSRYLKEMGFVFSENELSIHNLVAGNIFITSKEQLNQIDKWLVNLIQQNNQLKSFDQKAFNFVIARHWADSCGYTNLGVYAYFRFFKSGLKKFYPLGISGSLKLLGKCILRRSKD